MNYLLDTCVVSELIKKNPEPRVIHWLENADEEFLFLSVLTLGEIQKGIAKLSDPKKANRLKSWLEQSLVRRFTPRILPITTPTMLLWGTMTGTHEKKGTPVPVIDALLAATARHHQMTLVTRNTKDLARCGVKILDLWA